jgi:hypothetical protein
MARQLRLSRVSIRESNEKTDYASTETLVESLNAFRATSNVPVHRYIRDLLEGKIDSISFTKDKPYCYFFARRFELLLSLTIKENERVIDFSLPLLDAEKILAV